MHSYSQFYSSTDQLWRATLPNSAQFQTMSDYVECAATEIDGHSHIRGCCTPP